MGDYYTEDPSRLKGQPKRTIADYVESEGLLVPRRFDTLEEARKSKKAIYLRSEHPQEYSGMSGLLDSFRLGSKLHRFIGSKNLTEAIERYREEILNYEHGTALPIQYCDYHNINFETFFSETSFSLWEYLGGHNRTVISDSSVPHRFHVMTCGTGQMSYTIVDSGEITKEYQDPLNDELKTSLPKLLETYSKIKALKNFEGNHCPIMEFQTSKGKDYFLQYHRTRDFEQTPFVLDRPTEKGEIEVPFVRGSTPKEGIEAKVTVYYANSFTGRINPEDETGSYDLHYDQIFSEDRLKHRSLQLNHTKNFSHKMIKIIAGHDERSKLFKPKVSIIHNIYDLATKEEIKVLSEAMRLGKNSHIHVRFVSDGKRAFLSRKT